MKKKLKTTTDSSHGLPIAENILARNFTVEKPNTHWVSNITYLWTKKGWLYLAVIIALMGADHLEAYC